MITPTACRSGRSIALSAQPRHASFFPAIDHFIVVFHPHYGAVQGALSGTVADSANVQPLAGVSVVI